MGAGLAWLEYNQERVNQMNVFPVPDGDTGTNMRLTMHRAYEAIARNDEGHVGIVSADVAQGALRGARGNSGVILSQILKGFADGLRGHEVFDARQFAAACERAVEYAYKAVIEPVEGTILTVTRQGVDALSAYVEKAEQSDLRKAFDVLVTGAREALSRTPDLLPILKQAGVLDSGGQGLVFILEGMSRLLHGQPVFMGERETGYYNGKNWQQALTPEDEEGYGYDVQFLMVGEKLDVPKIRADIDAMGWSTLVVGDPNLVKVHVHVHDPGQPLSYAIQSGAVIDDIVVENMQQQYQNYVEDRLGREDANEHHHAREVDGIAVIAVASGEGMLSLFYDGLNAARVIAGGQTMNPSAEDFLAAIDSLPNEQIILLPNNKNVVMAAQQAASLARGKQIQVIATTTLPQGIAAMLAHMDAGDDASLDDVTRSMQSAARRIVTGEVTHATRDVELDGVDVKMGTAIGLLDGKLVTANEDVDQVVPDLVAKAGADETELVTLYYGEAVNPAHAQKLADRLAETFDGLQIDVVYGGQPLYPFIISIE
jgi:hypothetical protein